MIEALKLPVAHDVVAVLRDLLEQAEAGRIQAIAVATEVTDRSIGTVWAGDPDLWRMVGAMELLKARLIGASE